MKQILLSLMMWGGDWVIAALIASSIAALAAIIDRFHVLRAEGAALSSLRAPLLQAILRRDLDSARKALDAHPGGAARVLRETLESLSFGPEAAGEHLAAALADERRRLERRTMLLGTLGNNAPFIGLFGTVLGVIKSFHDLAQSGAGPEVVMAGLSEALIATAIGLLVALPCVFAFNAISTRIRNFASETEALGRRLTACARRS